MLRAQTPISCYDLKLMLNDSIVFHKREKEELFEAIKHAGFTVYKSKLNKKVCIKQY
jgi:hypothetical protein